MLIDDNCDENFDDDEVGLFHCTVCNTSFTSCRVFMTHVESHSGEDIMPPTTVLETTMEIDENAADQTDASNGESQSDQAAQDGVSYFGDIPASCTQCPRVFINDRALHVHMNKAHVENNGSPSFVPIFPAKDNKPVDTSRTESLLDDLGSVSCDECGRSFPTAKQTKVHKFKSHIEPRKKRELLFKQQQRLLIQANGNADPQLLQQIESKPSNILSSPTEFYCFPCEQSFSSRRSLVRHKGNIHGEKPTTVKIGPISCTLCTRPFVNERALRVHISQMHSKQSNSGDTSLLSDKSHDTSTDSLSSPKQGGLSVVPISVSGEPTAGQQLNVKTRRPVGSGHLQCSGCGRHFTRMNNLYRHRKLYCTPFQAIADNKAQAAVQQSQANKANDQLIVKLPSHQTEEMEILEKQVTTKEPENTVEISQTFACVFCPRTFATAALYRLHMLGHRRKGVDDMNRTSKRYHCIKCGVGFNHASNLYTHNKRFCRKRHMNQNLQKKAEKTADSRPLLQILESSKQPGYFTCPQCQGDFPTQHQLAVHALGFHNLTSFRFQFIIEAEDGHKAPLEWSTEDEAAALREAVSAKHHSFNQEPPPKNQCNICLKEFQTRRNLRRHRIRLHGELNETNESIDSSLISNSDYSLPPVLPIQQLSSLVTPDKLRTIEDGGSIECDSCAKWFSSPRALAVHKVRKHDAAPVCNIKRVRCEFCRKRFRNPITLSRHRQAHIDELTGVKKDNEETEAKEADNIMDLTPALELTGPFTEVTFDSFVQEQKNGNLEPSQLFIPQQLGPLTTSPGTHQQLDTTLRSADGQYKCRVCERLFVNRLSLTGHLKSHYKESNKPFSCGSCVRRFTSMNNLRYHRSKFCPVLQQQQIEEKVAAVAALTNKQASDDQLVNTNAEDIEVWLGGGSGLQCLHCQATFSDKNTLELHAMERHTSSPHGHINCFKCDRSFATYVAFRIHMTRAHTNVDGDNSLSPTIVHSEKLKMKIKVPPAILPRPTPFQPKSNLTLAPKPVVSAPPKPALPFVCTRCTRSFGTVYGLGAHMRFCRDPEQPKICCVNCFRIFKTEYALEVHKKNCKSTPTDKQLENIDQDSLNSPNRQLLTFNGKPGCKVCGRIFVSSQALGAHSRFCRLVNQTITPRPITPPITVNTYNCEVCGKNFTTKQSLGSHRRVHKFDDKSPSLVAAHGIIRNLPSEIEKETVTEKVEPSRDDNTENEIKEDTENKEEIQNNEEIQAMEEQENNEKLETDAKEEIENNVQLEKENGENQDEPKFRCDICDRRFFTSVNLGSHLRVHNDPSKLDHPCPNCSRRFATRSKLYYHQSWFCHADTDGERGMNGLNFGCSVCGLMFSSQSRLEKHKALQHVDFVPVKKKSRSSLAVVEEVLTKQSDDGSIGENDKESDTEELPLEVVESVE